MPSYFLFGFKGISRSIFPQKLGRHSCPPYPLAMPLDTPAQPPAQPCRFLSQSDPLSCSKIVSNCLSRLLGLANLSDPSLWTFARWIKVAKSVQSPPHKKLDKQSPQIPTNTAFYCSISWSLLKLHIGIVWCCLIAIYSTICKVNSTLV